jgi:alanyl-tRNA synthetase
MPDTLVTFASGATTGVGRVVRRLRGDRPAVVVDETPFHPIDHTWPDQPGDVGRCAGVEVIDTVMAAVGPDGVVRLGADIPVRRGEPGWEWLVAHQLATGDRSPDVGDQVELSVDTGRRAALSAAHTACHLAALAMNQATADLWRKPVREDSLGSPDLDQIAMQSSVMDVEGSTDVYRLGKSLRKKGFDAATFGERLEDVQAQVSSRLSAWLAAGGPVAVDDGGDRRVTARREWICLLPEGEARLPCGGTHVRNLSEFAAVTVAYDLDLESGSFTVRTTPKMR